MLILIAVDPRTHEAMQLAMDHDAEYIAYLVQHYQSESFRKAAKAAADARAKEAEKNGKIYVHAGIEAGIIKGRCNFYIVPNVSRM